MQSTGLQQLQQIRGAGYTITRHMLNIGIHSIDDLKGRHCEERSDAAISTRHTQYASRITLPAARYTLLSAAKSRPVGVRYTLSEIRATSDENDWKDKQ